MLLASFFPPSTNLQMGLTSSCLHTAHRTQHLHQSGCTHGSSIDPAMLINQVMPSCQCLWGGGEAGLEMVNAVQRKCYLGICSNDGAARDSINGGAPLLHGPVQLLGLLHLPMTGVHVQQCIVGPQHVPAYHMHCGALQILADQCKERHKGSWHAHVGHVARHAHAKEQRVPVT